MCKKFSLLIFSFFLLQTTFAQSKAWDRHDTFGKGMNLSWLENYWNGTVENGFMDYLNMNSIASKHHDLEVMKEMGINTLRLPVCFDVWEDGVYPYEIDMPHYFDALDSILDWSEVLGFNVLIEYHHGSLSENNLEDETERIIAIWKQVIERYGDRDPEKIFFEIYNEPHDIEFADWQNVLETIVDSLRVFDEDQTIIVGGGDYNSVFGLSNLIPLDDDNIIYTFHYYEPFLFTHQGAEWVGAPVATTGIPYPYIGYEMPDMNAGSNGTWGENSYNDYSKHGNLDTLRSWVADAKLWSEVNKRPVFCGEFGSYYKADDDSRCRYTKAIRAIMECNDMPWCYWEWDQGFSLFDGAVPALENLSECMLDAWEIAPRDTSQTNVMTNDQCLIYPNPTENILYVERRDLDVPMVLNICDTSGRLVRGMTLCVGLNEINVSELPSGIYALLFLNMDGDRLFGRKLVKH